MKQICNKEKYIDNFRTKYEEAEKGVVDAKSKRDNAKRDFTHHEQRNRRLIEIHTHNSYSAIAEEEEAALEETELMQWFEQHPSD